MRRVYLLAAVMSIAVSGVAVSASASPIVRVPHRLSDNKVVASKSGGPTSGIVWHFNVPKSDGGFRVDWSFNCAKTSGSGTFWFNVYAQAGAQILKGPDLVGSKKSGVSTIRKTGAVFANLSSSCDWTLQVLGGT